MQQTAKPWKSLTFYSTFLVAIAGAIPTGLDLIKAYQFGVSFGSVRSAEEQQQLWEKNFQCTANMKYQEVKTQQNILVKVGACNTGDVLINAELPEKNKRIVQWVSLEKLTKNADASWLFPVAHAQIASLAGEGVRTAQAPIAGKVQCQEWLDNTRSRVQRIVDEGGRCFLETIEIFTGRVSERREVPCDTKCTQS